MPLIAVEQRQPKQMAELLADYDMLEQTSHQMYVVNAGLVRQ